jgi:hypothetical protein
VFWVISVYFNIRNTLPKSGKFLLGHPVLYRAYTGYSCLIEDEPSGSKHGHVEGTVKIKVIFSFTNGAFCWFTLYDYTGRSKSHCVVVSASIVI